MDQPIIFVFCIEKYFCTLSSTDESLTPSYNLLTAHSSHHHLQQMPQMQLQTTSITSSSSIPHGMSNNLYQPTVHQTAGTSGIVQSLSHTQPLEQLAYTEEFFPPTAGIDEQYIYVTYPTEMKKRLSDRYDKDALVLMPNGYDQGHYDQGYDHGGYDVGCSDMSFGDCGGFGGF